jgi:hypothetical protein
LGEKELIRNSQFGDIRYGLETKKRVAISETKFSIKGLEYGNWLAITG